MDAINKLLLAFVTLIVGVVLLGSISTSVLGVNSGTQVVNETQAIGAAISGGITNTSYRFTVTNYPSGWKSTDCPLTGIAIKNGTNVALVQDTHYTFYPTNGTWYLKGATTNTSYFWANNNSYVSYTYCGDDYMNLGWGRSVLSVAVGMIAFDIYIIFFMNISWWFKGLTLFNSFWGFIFLLTSLIGQYQSYVTYMQTIESLNSDKIMDSVLQINESNMKGGI